MRIITIDSIEECSEFFVVVTFGKPGRGGKSVGDVSILRELGGRSGFVVVLACAV